MGRLSVSVWRGLSLALSSILPAVAAAATAIVAMVVFGRRSRRNEGHGGFRMPCAAVLRRLAGWPARAARVGGPRSVAANRLPPGHPSATRSVAKTSWPSRGSPPAVRAVPVLVPVLVPVAVLVPVPVLVSAARAASDARHSGRSQRRLLARPCRGKRVARACPTCSARCPALSLLGRGPPASGANALTPRPPSAASLSPSPSPSSSLSPSLSPPSNRPPSPSPRSLFGRSWRSQSASQPSATANPLATPSSADVKAAKETAKSKSMNPFYLLSKSFSHHRVSSASSASHASSRLSLSDGSIGGGSSSSSNGRISGSSNDRVGPHFTPGTAESGLLSSAPPPFLSPPDTTLAADGRSMSWSEECHDLMVGTTGTGLIPSFNVAASLPTGADPAGELTLPLAPASALTFPAVSTDDGGIGSGGDTDGNSPVAWPLPTTTSARLALLYAYSDPPVRTRGAAVSIAAPAHGSVAARAPAAAVRLVDAVAFSLAATLYSDSSIRSRVGSAAGDGPGDGPGDPGDPGVIQPRTRFLPTACFVGSVLVLVAHRIGPFRQVPPLRRSPRDGDGDRAAPHHRHYGLAADDGPRPRERLSPREPERRRTVAPSRPAWCVPAGNTECAVGILAGVLLVLPCRARRDTGTAAIDAVACLAPRATAACARAVTGRFGPVASRPHRRAWTQSSRHTPWPAGGNVPPGTVAKPPAHASRSPTSPRSIASSAHSSGGPNSSTHPMMHELERDMPDSAHLFWVPAHLHPEPHPREYQRALNTGLGVSVSPTASPVVGAASPASVAVAAAGASVPSPDGGPVAAATSAGLSATVSMRIVSPPRVTLDPRGSPERGTSLSLATGSRRPLRPLGTEANPIRKPTTSTMRRTKSFAERHVSILPDATEHALTTKTTTVRGRHRDGGKDGSGNGSPADSDAEDDQESEGDRRRSRPGTLTRHATLQPTAVGALSPPSSRAATRPFSTSGRMVDDTETALPPPTSSAWTSVAAPPRWASGGQSSSSDLATPSKPAESVAETITTTFAATTMPHGPSPPPRMPMGASMAAMTGTSAATPVATTTNAHQVDPGNAGWWPLAPTSSYDATAIRVMVPSQTSYASSTSVSESLVASPPPPPGDPSQALLVSPSRSGAPVARSPVAAPPHAAPATPMADSATPSSPGPDPRRAPGLPDPRANADISVGGIHAPTLAGITISPLQFDFPALSGPSEPLKPSTPSSAAIRGDPWGQALAVSPAPAPWGPDPARPST
ncbi:hypothetical protein CAUPRSCDRAFT_11131, partial [Caulochytrium protostelioides]